MHFCIIDMSKLAVHLVTWNNARFIAPLFASLQAQTFTDWTLRILDNNSQDSTVCEIKKQMNNFSVQYGLEEKKENYGFAGGHNHLFHGAEEEYILLLNPDIFLTPECLSTLIHFLDTHSDTAAVAPRLMKWDIYAVSSAFTNTVDSLGLKVFRNHRVVDWGTGQAWDKWQTIHSECTEPAIEVFGISGALPLFRREALFSVLDERHNIFDSTYGSYKEDVDLAYRLRARGLSTWVCLQAVAYHARTAAGPSQLDDRSAGDTHKKLSSWVRYQSYKNHLLTLYKNEYWQNFLLDFPFILWYELKKFVWCLCVDRPTLFAGWKAIWSGRRTTRNSRRFLTKQRTVRWSAMRKWWRSDN